MRGATWAQNVAEAPGQRPAYVSDFYGLVGFCRASVAVRTGNRGVQPVNR